MTVDWVKLDRIVSFLSDLRSRFGSPTYVYEMADVRAAYADLISDLPAPSRLYYSVKANPHPDVIAQMARLGSYAEVSSLGELTAATAAGFDAAHCLYTGPGKRSVDVAAGIAAGARFFSVDSASELSKLSAVAASTRERVDCLLRINTDVTVGGMGLTMTGRSSQFGVDLATVLGRSADFASTSAVRVVGVHLYMGSNIGSEDVLLQTFRVGIATARKVQDEAGVPIEVLNLGGGFGSPFARSEPRLRFPGLRDALMPSLDSAFPGWRDGTPKLAFESGRYLVGGCGTLASTVLDVKQSRGQIYVVLDAGINCLGGLAGLRRLPPVNPDFGGATGPVSRSVDVVGPLCTPADYISRGVKLPHVAAGDLVTISNVGAYGLTASLVAFLGHALPTEVVVDNGHVISATRAALIRSDVEEVR